jgi:hypothetical protein
MIDIIEYPDRTVNREIRLVGNDADIDTVIKALSNTMTPPKHIIRQLKAEQKRLFEFR